MTALRFAIAAMAAVVVFGSGSAFLIHRLVCRSRRSRAAGIAAARRRRPVNRGRCDAELNASAPEIEDLFAAGPMGIEAHRADLDPVEKRNWAALVAEVRKLDRAQDRRRNQIRWGRS